jgi:hypothetical protein
MSEDEFFVTIAAFVAGFGGWALWWWRTSDVVSLPSKASPLTPIVFSLVVATAVITGVVKLWADAVVREEPPYQFMYLFIGIAWLRFAEFAFHWGGISVRDDVVERRNPAAVPAIAGAVIGVACAYAGGNVGDGPGWWVVVIAAALGTSGIAIVWSWLSKFTDIIDIITIDRDVAAGVRFGGLMLASGAIAGRAVAGDWHGIDGMIVDFLKIFPAALALLLVAVGVERASAPTVSRPHPPVATFGVLPALLYVSAAAALRVWLGAPA